MRNFLFGSLVAAALAVSTSAGAATLVLNGDFETGAGFGRRNAPDYVIVNQGNVDKRLPGWGVESRGVRIKSLLAFDKYFSASSHFSGDFSFGLKGDNQISQSVEGLEAGRTYRIFFAWLGSAGVGINKDQVGVELNGVPQQFALSTGRTKEQATALGWKVETIDFVAVSDSAQLKFESLLQGDKMIALDAIRVSQVPLPAPAVLLAGALAGLGALRLRRRSA